MSKCSPAYFLILFVQGVSLKLYNLSCNGIKDQKRRGEEEKGSKIKEWTYYTKLSHIL